jgi:hypothetical protein
MVPSLLPAVKRARCACYSAVLLQRPRGAQDQREAAGFSALPSRPREPVSDVRVAHPRPDSVRSMRKQTRDASPASHRAPPSESGFLGRASSGLAGRRPRIEPLPTDRRSLEAARARQRLRGLALEQSVEEATTAHCSDSGQGDEEHHLQAKFQHDHLLLEPEVLERLCGPPVELGGHLVLTAPRREIALCDPSRRPMAY